MFKNVSDNFKKEWIREASNMLISEAGLNALEANICATLEFNASFN
jgi:hypothetical protein